VITSDCSIIDQVNIFACCIPILSTCPTIST
jgi:hypothetical protein